MELGFIVLLLLFHSVAGLQRNGRNVVRKTVYSRRWHTTSCGLFGWRDCTRYRSTSTYRFECKPGYRSTDNIGCPHSICDGDINPRACNINYTTSHIIYRDGSTQYSSGGRCDDNNPGTCLGCNEGFYNRAGRCRNVHRSLSKDHLGNGLEWTRFQSDLCTPTYVSECQFMALLTSYPCSYTPRNECTYSDSGLDSRSMCSAILNCDLETCTHSTDQQCTRCEGVTQERPGYRAYVRSSSRKTCTKSCSWRSDSTRCYPGTCNNEFVTSCRCSTGFSGNHCQTISAKPRIQYNILRLTRVGGDTDTVPTDTNAVPSGAPSWSNIATPYRVYYKFTAQYGITAPTPHAFIEGFSVGITRASATFKQFRGGRMVSTKTMSCDGVSRDIPKTDVYTCEGNPSPSSIFTLPFLHRDRIEISYVAENGGYIKVRNKETKVLSTHYYNGATQTHQFSVFMDLTNPYHCTGTTACMNTMLKTPNLIKTSNISISWRGWKDSNSGIKHFVVKVFELHAEGDELRQRRQVYNKTITSSLTTHSVRLPEVGVYSVILSVYDKVGNHRSARRALIYDDMSSVTTRLNTKLQITTASATAKQWQTSSSPVIVDWRNRYINSEHHDNNMLLGLATVGGVNTLYDDKEGDRTVDPIKNIGGIVRITTSYKIDHNGGRNIDITPQDTEFISQGLSQSQTISSSLDDGDTVRVWVRAFDVMSNYKEESVSVHIDTTPPVLDNLRVTHEESLNITDYTVEDLSHLALEWIAYDEHSGVQTVSWRLVDRSDPSNAVSRVHRIQTETIDIGQCHKVNATDSDSSSCYCTPAMGCYHRQFKVKPFVFDSAQAGIQGADFYLEVTVTNHAHLTTIQEIKLDIMCDQSTNDVNCSIGCDDGNCVFKDQVGPSTITIVAGAVTATVVILLLVVVVVVVAMKKRRLRSKKSETSDHVYYNTEVKGQGSKVKIGKRNKVPQENYDSLDGISREGLDRVTDNTYTSLETNTRNQTKGSPNMVSDVTEPVYEPVECMTYENFMK